MPRAHRYSGGMTALRAHLSRFGNAAQTHELVALGVAPHALTAAVRAKEIQRLRRGWYALPELDSSIAAAIRVGGRLACVSAAKYYGWATPQEHGLHVCVAENAARLRRPVDPETGRPTAATVIHWRSPRPLDRRERLVTDRLETVGHLAACLDPESVVAALDSFLYTDPVGSRDLDNWLLGLPDFVTAHLPSRNPLCQSYLESVGRIRLERAGITGRHQVEIPEVGRVDLLIGDRLVIEWDGGTHRTAEQQDEDCRRDARLATMGYRVLRFSYNLVMYEWHVVISAIEAVLAEIARQR